MCKVELRIRLAMHGASVGRALRVRGWINLHVHPTGTIYIGEDFRLKSGFSENAVGGFRRMGIWVGSHAELTISDRVGISNSTIVCMNAIKIEEDVYVGGDCAIYDTDFHSIAYEQRFARPDITVKTAPVVIRKRSFIGGHSIILKGVTIGEMAVIGAGSVVTKNVPPGEIWAGNPAKFIGHVSDSSIAG